MSLAIKYITRAYGKCFYGCIVRLLNEKGKVVLTYGWPSESTIKKGLKKAEKERLEQEEKDKK